MNKRGFLVASLLLVFLFLASGEDRTTFDVGFGQSENEEENLRGYTPETVDGKVTAFVEVGREYSFWRFALNWNSNFQTTWWPNAPGSEYNQANVFAGFNTSGFLPGWLAGSTSAGLGIDFGTKRSRPIWPQAGLGIDNQSDRFFVRPSVLVSARLAAYPLGFLGLGIEAQAALNPEYRSVAWVLFLSTRTKLK